MKKWRKWIGGLGACAMAGLQLANPPHQNPPVIPGHDVLARGAVPAPIAALLKRSCYDCHSYETKWPWYSYIVPVSWTVVGHVNDARDSLNFSEWPHDDARRVRKRWRHVADEVEGGDMPLPGYARIHRRAALDPKEREELVQWARGQGAE